MNMRTARTFAFVMALFALASGLQAATLDEVVARHIEAKGGRDAWKGVEGLKITGTYEAFSIPKPFTLIEKAPGRIYFDHYQGNDHVVLGFDGTTAWMLHEGYRMDYPFRLGRADRNVAEQESDLATPFFDYEERGGKVEYLGREKFEGVQGHKLKVTRQSGVEETWYLDPETYLEFARISTGSDYGHPTEMVTFFEDFRKVDGLVIPHHVESEFGIRLRVMDIEKVELNPEVEDALFELQPPAEMVPLAALAGNWIIVVEERGRPGMPFQKSGLEGVITSKMGKGLVELYIEDPAEQGGIPVDVTVRFTYDRFRKLYRFSMFDDLTSLLSVMEGTEKDGRITVDTMKSGTSWTAFGRTRHERISVFDVTPDAFQMERETSTDGGESWYVSGKLAFTRKVK